MSRTALIVAAAYKAWAEYQSERDNRDGFPTKTWAAIQEMFNLIEED